ncbi:MAG: DNA translocase FtsK [Chloroflexi bacterium]|nr:DNA translocase FtsK [Chloroflexota bacterium]
MARKKDKPSPISSAAIRQYETVGLILLAVGLLALLDLFLTDEGPTSLEILVGIGAYPVAFALVWVGLMLVFRRMLAPLVGPHWYPESLLGFFFLLLAALIAMHLRLGATNYLAAQVGSGGGLVGWALAESLNTMLGASFTWGVVLLLMLLGLALIYTYTPLRYLSLGSPPPFSLPNPLQSRARRMPDDEHPPEPRPEKASSKPKAASAPSSRPKPKPRAAPKPKPKPKPKSKSSPKPKPKRRTAPTASPARPKRAKSLPPLDLLHTADSGGSSEEQARIQAKIIEDTLQGFGIPATVTDINIGPTVTQFGVTPGVKTVGDRVVRVRVSKIVALADDLALALAASPIRIEAPVPGKPYIGVEVPNTETSMVSLRRLLEAKAFKALKSPLAIPIGRDVSGAAVAVDLHHLPHLLIAGATGSGKSVALNSIICALLFNNQPDSLQLILIDPKRVEFPGYNGVPHLIAPVVTDMEHAEGALTWLLITMDERYRLFSEAGARDIGGYNRKVHASQRLPYIVLIIDELADLMVTSSGAIEAKLVRLAQMARATGIHLVVATQRPSVNVVTGLIKANFPARLAFAVTSQVDSRVILDAPGAEKLLGRGDGLLMTSDSAKLRRIQGCFVSDGEIMALVNWWKQAIPPETSDPLQPRYPWSELMVEEATADDLFQKAVESLRGRQYITTSALQRILGIGHPRAARLMEELEAKGIIGAEVDPRSGRRVLIEDELDE